MTRVRKEKQELKLKKGNSSNQYSQQMFKVEGKVEIKLYKGEVDIVKLYNWLLDYFKGKQRRPNHAN
jgi:hypothetical protein